MKKTSLVLFCCYALFSGMSSAAEDAETVPASVMLLGTVHFANPGLDSVKSDVIDVTQPESQQWLEAFTSRLAKEFQPTVVVLEYPTALDEKINARYQDWRSGERALSINEIEQIGFRVAAAAGLPGVSGFDHTDVGWAAEPMFDWAKANAPERLAAMEAEIESLSAEQQRMQSTLSLGELLLINNDPADWAANRGLYIASNDLGALDDWSGADATASWWRRNLRMYALVQRAAQPGERVLVLAGSGHIAVIAQFLESDPSRKAVDVRPVLRAVTARQ